MQAFRNLSPHRERIFMLVWVILACFTVLADNVTLEQAEQIARDFLDGRQPSGRKQLRISRRQPLDVSVASDASAYYVFNIGEEEGFAIVSGSNLAPQVLAFSESGAFREEGVPENMQAWLDGYAEQIAYLERTGGKNEAPRLNGLRSAVRPLLTSTWYQDSPYNNKCPIYPATGERCATGCVATAMAQVINYHKYPGQTKTVIPAYTTNSLGIRMPAIGITSIDWNNMLDDYSGSSTAAQQSAVANLMLLCGQSVHMDYGPSSGISKYDAPVEAEALQRYFGYDPTVRSLERNAFGKEEWESLIYDEVKAGRPVIYNGLSSGGGHAFVVDGYDTSGLFHINWGWGGSSDGYFVLSVLNPYNTSSTGASSSNDGFSIEQKAIVGIQHSGEEPIPERYTVLQMMNKGASSYTRTKTAVDFSGIDVWAIVENRTGGEHTFNAGVILVDPEGNPVTDVLASVNEGSDFDQGDALIYKFPDLSFGADLPNGDYYIIPVSATENSVEWEPCWRSNVHRIKATIRGIRLTLTEASVNLDGDILSDQYASHEWSTLTAQITNNGSSFSDYVYLCEYVTTSDGNGYMKLGGQFFEIGEGETATYEIDYAPTRSGTHTLCLATYDELKNTYTFFAPKVITVVSPLEYSVGITNATEGVVPWGTVNASVEVMANMNFNNYVRMRLFKLVGSNYELVRLSEQQRVTLSAGSSTTLSFEFDDLEENQEYLLSFVYITGTGLADDGGYATFSTDASKVTLNLTATPAGGIVGYGQEVTLKANKTGAQIFYTIDGTEPARSSYLYSSPFPIDRNMTVKARAFLDGYIDSEVLTRTYQAKLDINANMSSGSAWVGDKLILTCTHPDAVIYYTTDGSAPTRQSQTYTSPIIIEGPMTVKAVSMHDDCLQSDILTRTFTVPAASLSFSPAGGTVQKGTTVTITPAPADADIYYTHDGSEPTMASDKYQEPITITKNTKLKAIAYRQGYLPSSVLSADYYVKLTLSASLAAGTVDYLSQVELHADDDEAAIYYTTDGSTPTQESLRYTEPIVIDESMTVRAVAMHEDYLMSDMLSRTYTVLRTSVGATPLTTNRLVAGNEVSLTASPSGSRIYYTTDGTEPTEAQGTLYTSPIVVEKTFVLKAKAYYDGYKPNDTFNWNYNVAPEPRVITVTPAELELFWGRTARLTYAFTPSDAETLWQEWESSNPEVATITPRGLVRALTPGHTTLTLTARNGVVGKCELTVPDPLYQLFVWTKAGIKTGYLSTDEPQFNVEGDIVHFTTSHLSMDIHRDTLDKFTLEPVLPEHPRMLRIPSVMSIPLGMSEKIDVAIWPKDATTTLKWFNDNPKVASITQDGKVTALQAGQANLMLQTDNGLHASCRIIVPEPYLCFFVWLYDGEVHRYELSDRPEVKLGETVFTLTTEHQTVEYKAADIMMFTLQDEALVDGVSAPEAEQTRPGIIGDNLSVEGGSPFSPVRIYDTAGRLVQTAETDGDGNLSLPLASLRAGIYIICTEKTTFKIQKK